MEFNATFIASALSFILFTLIMNAIFYKPLAKIVAERQKFVDETIEDAKTKVKKSEAIMKDKAGKLENTKHDAKKIITDKTDEAKAEKAEKAKEAQEKALNSINAAKEELHKSKAEAQTVLSSETDKLAQEISAKILGNI